MQAAAQILKLSAANIILLGEEAQISSRAKELHLDLDGIQVVSLRDKERLDKYASRLAELRAHKGVTIVKPGNYYRIPPILGL